MQKLWVLNLTPSLVFVLSLALVLLRAEVVGTLNQILGSEKFD